MSEQQLRELLAFASDAAERFFNERGEVAAMWHAVRSNGDQFVEAHPMWLGKDNANALIRAQFDLMDVIRYVYIGEAWTLSRAVSDNMNTEMFRKLRSLEDHPDRLEIVMIQGEDQECGQIMAQREIIRKGKPRLGPLEITIEPGDGGLSEGRMVGMLPARGTKQ